jgi:hypothetical protein
MGAFKQTTQKARSPLSFTLVRCKTLDKRIRTFNVLINRLFKGYIALK